MKEKSPEDKIRRSRPYRNRALIGGSVSPPRGTTDSDEGWRKLCVDVMASAARGYYTAKIEGQEPEAQALGNFMLDPRNPWNNFANIDPDFYIDILARINDAIEKGEHYHAKHRQPA